jgi:penicillin-binding protein 1A
VKILKRRPAFFVVVLALSCFTLWLGYLTIDVATRLPDPRALASLERMPEATVVYDVSGRPVFTIFREQRVRVPLERLSPQLLDAVLAIEDRRFYQHGGIDLVRVAGAAVANLTAGRIVQGGSTITQQLARQNLLSREKTFRRKLAEILTALRIERSYSKKEILELYLNRIYFGSGLYGAEAAARGYFGKPAAELSLSDAALLAGLIQAPERYSPRLSPQQAVGRRNVVLRAMLETGVIDERAYQLAFRQPLILNDGLQAAGQRGGYFKEEVRRRLIDMFGWEAVYEQGLRVYSTIDPKMQRAAEEALERGIRRIEARRPTARKPDSLQGALIALEPRSGEVRALVGGRDVAVSPFNRATQARRQAGSAFKPILYAAALDQGLTPVTVLDDLDHPFPAADGDWLPAEAHDEVSALTVRAALQVSSNRAAVRLLTLTGIDRTVDYAARFGLGPQPRVPSVALGSGSVTLEALTAAYAAFANRGTVPEPTYIRRVTDAGGAVLFEADAHDAQGRAPAVSPATAFIVANLLRGVVDAGTGAGVRREGFVAPAAGKTGTTDDYKDAWFVGFTPDLAAGVWVGFDEPRTILRRGYASDVAAPVWASFMTEAVGSRGTGKWIEPPPGVIAVEVCVLSGLLATDACRRRDGDLQEGIRRPPTYIEFFAAGTEPLEQCSRHRSFLALLAAPFRGLSRPDRPELEPPPPAEPAAQTESTVDEANPSVAVVHDHAFGSCAGRLIVDPDGIRYFTAHKDAFAVNFTDLARVEVDTRTGRLQIKVRRGRTYNFQASSAELNALASFEAALDVK